MFTLARYSTSLLYAINIRKLLTSQNIDGGSHSAIVEHLRSCDSALEDRVAASLRPAPA
jgi:hypothetical protein